MEDGSNHSQPIRLTLALLIGGTALGVVLLPAGHLQHLFIFLLLWIWPAITWQTILPGPAVLRWLAGGGSAILINALLLLIIHYIPGAVPTWLLRLVALNVALIPLLIGRSRPFRLLDAIVPTAKSEEADSAASTYRRLRWAWLALILLTIALRFPNLGYKELQGDEGIILVRAAAALSGDDSELFLHQKGPIEILIPMLTWGMSGELTETWARLPFTWAGLLLVIGVGLLTANWCKEPISRRWLPLLAAGLFTISGFAVGFSRIIQYQTFVMLFGLLAILYFDLYRENGDRFTLWVGAVFLAGGLLSHYDAVLTVPLIGWLLVARWRQQRVVEWRPLITAGLVGAVVLGLFYVPFMRDPSFANTIDYLLNDRVGASDGGSFLHWSGGRAWEMATFYHAIYYVVSLYLLGLVAFVATVRRQSVLSDHSWLYLVVPTAFYLFIVVDPRTHIYTLLIPTVIVAAAGGLALWRSLNGTRWQSAATLFAIALYALSLSYTILLFVDVKAERQRQWESWNRTLYPVTWEEPPLFGRFGFPYQAGWRAVGGGQPAGSHPYASNEEEEITNWYMGQASRTHCNDANTFYLANNVQDVVPFDASLLDQLSLGAEIYVDGRLTMQRWDAAPVEQVEQIDATRSRLWRSVEEVAPPRPTPAFPLDVQLGTQARLLGYDIDDARAVPNGIVWVTLYWEALAPFERNYQSYVHLNDGIQWAQHDGAPECGINPTTRWEPGQIISDPHGVVLPGEIPAGEIPIYVGLYDLITLDRLPVPDWPDDRINIGVVTIGP